MRRHIHTFDRIINDYIKSLPEWLQLPMVVVSFLGQPVVTGGLAALIVGVGYGRDDAGLMMAGVVAIATLVLSSILKLILRRNRPITEYVERMFFHTYSFPSGHAAGSLPSFGLLAYLLLQILPVATGLYIAIAIALVVMLIGVSRVYLGAHYASDVIGGWIVGFAGLAVIIFIVQPTI